MFRNNQLKLRRANFTTHSVSHQNQNGSFDHGSRLDRRVMRNVANRASRIRTPRVMVREVRLSGHEQQRKEGHAHE